MRQHQPSAIATAVSCALVIGASVTTLEGQYSLTVNEDRLNNAQNEPQNWLLMNGDYGSQRYSKLTQIDRNNVENLRMVWALAIGGMQDTGQNGPEAEMNPLIDNGFMYTSDGWGTIYKIDARQPDRAEFVWITDPGVDHEGNTSRTRGIALWEDRVIANLPDGRVIAIDRDDGEIIWDVEIAGVNEFGARERFLTAPLRGRRHRARAQRGRGRRHAGLGRGARRGEWRGAMALVYGAGAGATRERNLER